MKGAFALVVTFAAGTALAPIAADAALLSLTGGKSFDTTSRNDVLGAGKTLLNDAGLSTTQDGVKLTFLFGGSESGFKNTLNVGGSGGGTHTEVDNAPIPLIWPGPRVIGPVTQESAGPVDMFFTSNGFSGQLKPGQGDPSKSIAFAYVGESGGTSDTPTNLVLFALDDGGAAADSDYDDYVGYVMAEALPSTKISEETPLTPTPVPAALPMLVTAMVGLGLIGRRKKATT